MHSPLIHLGHVHVPVFGVFAAIGVMAALGFSQRTARYAGLDAAVVWDAGVTAVVSAFLVSRVLLVLFNWKSFLAYPWLLLAVPSLTGLGVAMTAVLMAAYVRWRVIPLLPLLDAAAPCSALLWATLSLGRFVAGDRDGLPATREGLAFRLFGAVYPVELFASLAAATLCIVLLLLLSRTQQGWTAGAGLLLAGLCVYCTDFFRLPSDLLARAMLDPVQMIAVAMMVAGCALLLPSLAGSARSLRFRE